MFSAKAFNPRTDIPNLEGKVILVTGGNAGLGKETVINLARHKPQRIWLAARSQAKAESAMADIEKTVPGAPVSFLSLDLASFASISEAAKAFQSSSSRLDILFNNAGIMAVPNAVTTDGYEIQFGTNVMGSFLFTRLLMPILQSTAKEPGSDVRIINLTSEAHRMQYRGLVLDQSEMTKLSPWGAYSNSKLGNILFARECARRYPDITSVSVHPGIIAGTALWDSSRKSGIIGNTVAKVAGMLFSDIEQGVRNQLWAATCPKDQLRNGHYYVPVGSESGGSWKASNTNMDSKLWDWIEGECQKKGY